LAKTCNKIPLISNIVDKLLFEGDDIQVLPRDGTINNLTIKDITINKDIPFTPNVVLPSEVLREVVKDQIIILLWISAFAGWHLTARIIPTNLDVYF